MEFETELKPARLIRRYKRFLADIEFDDGRAATAHCPNPGRMTGLAEPGTRIWVEDVSSPKRKLRYSWRLSTSTSGTLVGIDTSIANRIVGDALRDQRLNAFAGFDTIESEITVVAGSRFDFRIRNVTHSHIIEVKSVTLVRETGLAEFPDAPSDRAVKHAQELAKLAESGQAAAMVFLVQRSDCSRLTFAGDIDPSYVSAVRAAQRAGVGLYAYSCDVKHTGIELTQEITEIAI